MIQNLSAPENSFEHHSGKIPVADDEYAKRSTGRFPLDALEQGMPQQKVLRSLHIVADHVDRHFARVVRASLVKCGLCPTNILHGSPFVGEHKKMTPLLLRPDAFLRTQKALQKYLVLIIEKTAIRLRVHQEENVLFCVIRLLEMKQVARITDRFQFIRPELQGVCFLVGTGTVVGKDNHDILFWLLVLKDAFCQHDGFPVQF